MNEDKNSFAYKVQKNPFIIGLFLVIAIIFLVVVITLSSVIQSKTQEVKSNETSTTEKQVTTTEAPNTNTFALSGLKKHVDGIKSVNAVYDVGYVKVTVAFEDEETLLSAHLAANFGKVNVYPVFSFYTENGVEIKCPAEMVFLADGTGVQYTLRDIDDLVNAVAIADNTTVSYSNLFDVLKFNIYMQHKTQDASKTVIGTYATTHEQFVADYGQKPPITSNVANGIKNIELTKCDKFLWLDIYFDSEEDMLKLTNDLADNFICFGFEKGGLKYQWKFIATEYEDIYMIRCKFDSYALTQLQSEISDVSMTIDNLFQNYQIDVWSSDYGNDIPLFTIN
ncbi:MAG: hypothetical protein ACI4IF_08505 [Acutalibacteraceae bacterium]